MSWVTIIEFIGLFTLFHGSNRNQQGGHVPLMRPAALCSGLTALSCGWVELWRNPPTLKKKKKKKHYKNRLLNVMVGYLCVQNLTEWAWTIVVERQRAILEDECHHTSLMRILCTLRHYPSICPHDSETCDSRFSFLKLYSSLNNMLSWKIV